MGNSVVRSQQREPANPESDEDHSQSQETQSDEHVISFTFEEGFRTLMDLDATVEEEDDGHKPIIGQVPMLLGMESELNKWIQPHIMSFGPIHHDTNNLEQGHKYKLQMAKRFIEQNSLEQEIICNEFLEDIESFKNCYDRQELQKKFRGNNECLAWMFFVDGCALMELIQLVSWPDFCSYDITADQLDLILTRDLLLLENQLPLKVLKLVMRFDRDERNIFQWSLGIIAHKYFKISGMDIEADSVSFNEANHLLGLIWMTLAGKEKDSRSFYQKARPGQFKSVKILQAAGIILEPSNSSDCLRDISFNQGIFLCKLKIPRFRVSEDGKLLVFNLIAFEMYPNFDKDYVVTSYISFLNSIIATKEDVAELQKVGILFNDFRNDEEQVLKTFRELTSSMKSYLDIHCITKSNLIHYLHDEKSMKKWIWSSEAMQIYFKSPWTILAFVSGTFFLILTIIQTVFSILAYATQKNNL